MKIQCLIIDDEPLARKGMEKFVGKVSYLELFKSCDSAQMAFETMEKQPIDLIFLDIQMPGTTGLELLKKLDPRPVSIITTAYPNYALEGFELDVMDYLVKPIPFSRFEKAVAKAREFWKLKKALQKGHSNSSAYFFVKCENRFEKIMYEDLLFVEAMQNYVIFHTASKKYVSYLTLKLAEESLPSDKFIKVHKSYIVALDKIENIEGRMVKIGDKRIGIGKNNKEEILKRILGNNLLKR